MSSTSSLGEISISFYDDFWQVIIQGIFRNEKDLLEAIANKTKHREKFLKKIDGFRLKTYKTIRSVNRIWRDHADRLFQYDFSKLNYDKLIICDNAEAILFFVTKPFTVIPDEMISCAIWESKEQILRILLERRAPTDQHLRSAVKNKRYGAIELLLDDGRVDGKVALQAALSMRAYDSSALFMIAEKDKKRNWLDVDGKIQLMREALILKNYKIVSHLASDPQLDLSVGDNEFIKRACKVAYVPIVSLLCKHEKVDPFAGPNSAFDVAVEHNRKKVVEFLLKWKTEKAETEQNSLISDQKDE